MVATDDGATESRRAEILAEVTKMYDETNGKKKVLEEIEKYLGSGHTDARPGPLF